MSEKTPPKNNTSSEEVDLGQLFKLIGDAFNRFFRFIGNIFKGIFYFLVGVLIFIKIHFVKFAIAGLVGIIIGGFVDYTKEPSYLSTMVVEPNFNSVQQLYNNINFYNELATAKDSSALADALNISVEEAASIKKMQVRSFSDENQKVLLFDKFVRELDSTTRNAIDFEAYLENFNTYDARFHEISLISTESRVASKTQDAIVSAIGNNSYFQLQKQVSDENISMQDSIYKGQLRQVDSLQKLYRDVMIKTAENPLQGTNINLAEQGKQNRELELLQEIYILKQNLVDLNLERANKANTLNIISAFPQKGVEMKALLDRYIFLGFAVAILLTFVVLLLLELNKYLTDYQNRTA